jgi:sec-independent protein translocase protein TatA
MPQRAGLMAVVTELAGLPGLTWGTLHVGCAARCSGPHVRFGGYMFEGLFQPMHLLVIFFIALLVFGPKKLPELGKGLGEGIRALKDGMKDTDTKTEVKTEVKPENKA